MNYFKERRKRRQEKKERQQNRKYSAWEAFCEVIDVIGEGIFILLLRGAKVFSRFLD